MIFHNPLPRYARQNGAMSHRFHFHSLLCHQHIAMINIFFNFSGLINLLDRYTLKRALRTLIKAAPLSLVREPDNVEVMEENGEQQLTIFVFLGESRDIISCENRFMSVGQTKQILQH